MSKSGHLLTEILKSLPVELSVLLWYILVSIMHGCL